MQNIVGHFLVLALIGVPGPFNKDQAVFGSGRNVVIQIAQKLRGVSVCEIIVGATSRAPVCVISSAWEKSSPHFPIVGAQSELGDDSTDAALGQFVVDLIGFCYQGKMPETIEVTMIKEDLWKIDSFETTRPALSTVRVLSG